MPCFKRQGILPSFFARDARCSRDTLCVSLAEKKRCWRGRYAASPAPFFLGSQGFALRAKQAKRVQQKALSYVLGHLQNR